MTDNWAVKGVSRDGETGSLQDPAAVAPEKPPRSMPRARLPLSNVLSMAVALVGLAALGASAFVYADTQRAIKRVSTDIAQIRVSLELYGRQQAASGSVAGKVGSVDDQRLLDLSNRLALLEANQANPGSAAAATLPAGAASAGGVVASGGDCLPSGTRFMVAAGDSYPVCGTTATVSIAAIDQGYITLGDGNIIAQGGTIALAGTKCMLGVLPSTGDSISGFAEIRVAC